jgi:hypothetical protein
LVRNHSNQKFFEVYRLHLCLQLLLHVGAVDDKLMARKLIRVERNLLNHLLDQCMQPTRSQILSQRVHLESLLSQLLNRLTHSILTSSVHINFTFSASNSFCCWKMRLNYGYFKILTNYALLIGARLTLIGKRPSSSGMRFSTLAIEKDPLAMKRIWSVLTSPNLVGTVVPSIKGSRSLCTPSVDTPFPRLDMGPYATASLSISSKNTMPSYSTILIAYLWISRLAKLLFSRS